MTVLEVIQRSTEFLAKKGVDSPRLQVELLLAHQLQLPRMRLYLNFEQILTPAELEGIRELVRRRGQREPLQHILGSTSFYGLELAVTPDVLIPRPGKTELLAELGWEFLNVHAAGPCPAPRAIDFGTGSGCLAIALAVKSPASRICAVDISPPALALARRNATAHGVENRIDFFNCDGFPATLDQHAFDLVISNPPYIPTVEIPTLDPEVRDHDPRAALDGGPDGLNFYRRLAVETAPFLKPAGRLMLEFGDGQAPAIGEIFRQQKWVVEAVKPDYTGKPRILMARQGE